MSTMESQTRRPEWAAFVRYLLQSHTVHDLALAAHVHDYQIDRWLNGDRPTEWQIDSMAFSLDWSIIRQLRALDAAGYSTPRHQPRQG